MLRSRASNNLFFWLHAGFELEVRVEFHERLVAVLPPNSAGCRCRTDSRCAPAGIVWVNTPGRDERVRSTSVSSTSVPVVTNCVPLIVGVKTVTGDDSEIDSESHRRLTQL